VGNLDIKKIVTLILAAAVLSACQPSDKKDEMKADETKTAMSTEVSSSEASATDSMKEEDKMGYALGAKMASFIRADIDGNKDLNVNKESITQGFTDGLNNQTKLTEQEIATQFTAFQQKMQATQQAKAAKQQEDQKGLDKELIAAGDAFLTENGKKEGVKTTETGLQYDVITAGKEGAKPSATQTVKVHYTGSLIDGKVFDSSVERGTPAEFPLNRVISGWTEGLQLMSVGSKYHFVIPWKLAYGATGRPGSIPRHAVLQFDVELLEIVAPPKKQEAKKEISKK